ncbi:MAG: Aminotransferase, class I and II [Parcubacteria group bacterium GW2011_GWC2_42_12]|uniref:alanine transaminase n=2 Tax=Candidatus Falkowiibacteriota TaxID=1752728 RepID=A0A0G0USE7_9BACT|nr:MAG: Aminotransferase, class I and II [Candidatus Falkowbacteria bacterium GW2011_GWA2_41_14]KKS35123.1 MAG: Aminotransferase, class I and II [Parcubacteria group bacterium GW2011_GWC2_42_12]
MKTIINRARAALLKYDIRALAVIADKLKTLGRDIWAWENIGDPIKQGHQAPDWIKQALINVVKKNSNWGYSPTEGLDEAREFIAATERQQGIRLAKQDIVFTSGLGHGINTLYQSLLNGGGRAIHPSPAYPAHSSSESFFAGAAPIFYACRATNNWQPNLNDLEEKIKKHPEIRFILTIFPNNPTSVCYSDEILKGIAALARRYDLGVISDETYIRLLYKNQTQTGLAKIMSAGQPFPLIVMKSTSKDIPWPGGRSGWLEFYNLGQDKNFAELEETIKQNLRVQVGSTTMVQAALPAIYGDPRYQTYLAGFIAKLEKQSRYISALLNTVKGIYCVPGQGAFYLAAVFKDGVLRPGQSLPITNAKAKEYIESLTADPNLPLDKRFAFYLMAAKGIILTPLSSFEGPPGFRVTTLKTDLKETKKVYAEIKSAIEQYLASSIHKI